MDLLTAIRQAIHTGVTALLESYLDSVRTRPQQTFGRRVICGRCHRPLQYGHELDGVFYGRVCWRKMTAATEGD